MAPPQIRKQLEKVMRGWRGIKAAIGDRVFYVSVDGTREPAIHKAWVEEVDQARILVRTAASPSGDATGDGQGTRWCCRLPSCGAILVSAGKKTRTAAPLGLEHPR
jgi:hypothetical protein